MLVETFFAMILNIQKDKFFLLNDIIYFIYFCDNIFNVGCVLLDLDNLQNMNSDAFLIKPTATFTTWRYKKM